MTACGINLGDHGDVCAHLLRFLRGPHTGKTAANDNDLVLAHTPALASNSIPECECECSMAKERHSTAVCHPRLPFSRLPATRYH